MGRWKTMRRRPRRRRSVRCQGSGGYYRTSVGTNRSRSSRARTASGVPCRRRDRAAVELAIADAALRDVTHRRGRTRADGDLRSRESDQIGAQGVEIMRKMFLHARACVEKGARYSCELPRRQSLD